MALESLRIAVTLPATPALVYASWLSSVGHTDMTGGRATCAPGVGGKFTAWDGYIWGTTLELDPNRRIVQSWRTIEFPAEARFSKVVLHLAEAEAGTLLTLLQSDIPPGQAEKYRKGWHEHYFEPMCQYFLTLRVPGTKRKPKRRSKAVRKAASNVGRTRKPARKAKSKGGAAKPARKQAKATTRKPRSKRRK
ncbi:MAG: SRPBCC domain-containing protein [Planctomycetes bacterium]|nr:SRPBCC domain-containing protein [Planctomycetota bacterium]